MEYKILYGFQSHGITILEVKRMNEPETADPDLVYFWLKISGPEQSIERLIFVDSDSNETEEFREFEQGELCFDENIAEYIEDDGVGYALDVIGPEDLDPEIYPKIESLLEGIKN